MYDKNNVIEPILVTEIDKLITVYGSISYFDKKSANVVVEIILFNNPLKFSVAKNTIKKPLEFQLAKINGTLLSLECKKVHNFALTERKIPKNMAEKIESVIISGQQKFNLHDDLNPVQIEITDDRILNKLKKYKNTYYNLTPTGILFPSSMTKNRKQIFVTCRELNNENIALINGKVYNILGVTKGKIIAGK